jgi:RNA-directed DNA polymerase
MHALRGSNAKAVITALNPIVKGWAAYYRGVVSKKTFSSLDDYMWALTYKWAVYSHANKPKRWVAARYFGKFNKFRNDRWVFGDAASGAYLARFAWTDIVRPTLEIGPFVLTPLVRGGGRCLRRDGLGRIFRRG